MDLSYSIARAPAAHRLSFNAQSLSDLSAAFRRSSDIRAVVENRRDCRDETCAQECDDEWIVSQSVVAGNLPRDDLTNENRHHHGDEEP